MPTNLFNALLLYVFFYQFTQGHNGMNGHWGVKIPLPPLDRCEGQLVLNSTQVTLDNFFFFSPVMNKHAIK